jgi:hypothetical protein
MMASALLIEIHCISLFSVVYSMASDVVEWTQDHFDQAILYSQVISGALAGHLPAANDEVL